MYSSYTMYICYTMQICVNTYRAYNPRITHYVQYMMYGQNKQPK